MDLGEYVACICEGAAEEAIMNILLENDLLIFSREKMIEERVIRCRDGKKFEKEYLRKSFNEKISVIRILDSRNENFKIGKAYQHKVDIIDIITAPEIEMLIIFAENKYTQFIKTGKKPSDFCTQDLRMSNVKNYNFVYDYFSDVTLLITAIKEYHRVKRIPKGEKDLLSILKQC